MKKIEYTSYESLLNSLINVELYPTDGEEIVNNAPHLTRCIFCAEKVLNNFERWYLTIDLKYCICEDCYRNNNDNYKWKILDGWDIDWTV